MNPVEGPFIVVVGAQKAATSTLANLLASHRDVTFLPGEFHEFQASGDESDPLRTLEQRFDALPERSARGFKCASYLAKPEVAVRIARDLPDAHIVITLRDPVRRAVSAWYWYVKQGVVPLKNHETGLRAVLRGEVDGPRWTQAAEVLEWGRYGLLVGAWTRMFPRDHIHILTEQSWRPEQLPDTWAILQHRLGLEEQPLSSTVGRSNTGIYSMLRLRWLRLRRPFIWHRDPDGVWRIHRPKQRSLRAVDAAIVVVDRLILRWFGRSRVKISDELRALLDDYYRSDQLTLSEILRQNPLVARRTVENG